MNWGRRSVVEAVFEPFDSAFDVVGKVHERFPGVDAAVFEILVGEEHDRSRERHEHRRARGERRKIPRITATSAARTPEASRIAPASGSA